MSNWRLTLVQLLPAIWIWVAMADLRVHVLQGNSFNVLRGPVLIPIILAIVAITAASFFLNAVFAFAITRPGRPEIRPAVAQARRHLTAILVVGRGGRPAARAVDDGRNALGSPLVHALAGHRHRRDDGLLRRRARPTDRRQADPIEARQAHDELVSSVLGATVSAPPYILGRIGLLMLGSSALLIPGIVLIALGVTLQAGATGAVRAIKMSASLTEARQARSAID